LHLLSAACGKRGRRASPIVPLRSSPRAPPGHRLLRGRASPFGVPSASLRLSRLLGAAVPPSRRTVGTAFGRRRSVLLLPPGALTSRGEVEGSR
jgi:hypothetical protein